jgi:integrase
MAKGTIRGIHAILSGAFEAAMRWDWTDRNPAASARPPTPSRQAILATSPEDVAKVIAEARARSAALGLYLWLWWSPASAAAGCAACRSATSTWTAP